MDIYIKWNNNKQSIQIPILPESFEIEGTNNNTTVTVHGLGDINLKGKRGLYSLSFESFFPKYALYCQRGSHHDPYTYYVKKLKALYENNTTVHVIITETDINGYFTVESFDYGHDDNPFKLTYSGKKLEDKVMETVYDSPSFEGSVSMGRSPGYEVGENSTALGLKVAATGYASHAEGVGSKAAGEYSHAEGDNSKAEAHSAHAEGTGCKAGGVASHAEGSSCTASGIASHAEGTSCTASGNRSHAEGNVCKATGEHSHAEGDNTVAAGECSHVQGRYNVEDTDNKYAHIVGGGTWVDRKNIHTVDWDGNRSLKTRSL